MLVSLSWKEEGYQVTPQVVPVSAATLRKKKKASVIGHGHT